MTPVIWPSGAVYGENQNHNYTLKVNIQLCHKTADSMSEMYSLPPRENTNIQLLMMTATLFKTADDKITLKNNTYMFKIHCFLKDLS